MLGKVNHRAFPGLCRFLGQGGLEHSVGNPSVLTTAARMPTVFCQIGHIFYTDGLGLMVILIGNIKHRSDTGALTGRTTLYVLGGCYQPFDGGLQCWVVQWIHLPGWLPCSDFRLYCLIYGIGRSAQFLNGNAGE